MTMQIEQLEQRITELLEELQKTRTLIKEHKKKEFLKKWGLEIGDQIEFTDLGRTLSGSIVSVDFINGNPWKVVVAVDNKYTGTGITKVMDMETIKKIV